ncbi:hypothetical protein [Aestuariivivens sp. NBU2969]|uniref:hypothetical protein n=1 Tax=Aestuariivivens sp. NBU2969 TaxID=2873267 RepID=UPI001CC193CB|nr:hypothetical protein [Aestuariivivens sp. NBU2969]
MKKVILLLLTMGMCISSCSKDDETIDSITKDTDIIIGTWGKYKDVNLEDKCILECDPYDFKNQVQFLEKGTLLAFFERETSYVDGTWEKMNNGTYKMVCFGKTEIIDIDFTKEDEMVYRYPDAEYYWVRIR